MCLFFPPLAQLSDIPILKHSTVWTEQNLAISSTQQNIYIFFIIIAPIFLIPQERKIKRFQHTDADTYIHPTPWLPVVLLTVAITKKKNNAEQFCTLGGHSDFHKKNKKNKVKTKTPTHYFIQKGIQAISQTTQNTPPATSFSEQRMGLKNEMMP